jgi:hypothetical protein
MTRLGMDTLVLPAADLGEPNPLPAFREPADDREVRCDDTVPPEDRGRLGRACGTRILPWPVQDGYDDRPVPREFRALVLENECLRAVVLPALGGRLWSLVDRRDGRELLARNPVVRYANVALCNAWVAGGIEWNCGRLGHHWLTSSPVFAGLVRGPDDAPVLRLWEFDRLNRVVWQVDLHLPAESLFLFACVRLVNLNDVEIPAYWWTNMAVPEGPDLRTLVPADRVLRHDAKGVLGLTSLPRPDGFDVTRATGHDAAWEGFFHIDGARPFVAVTDGSGRGFVETSTRRLRGRKMFAWGAGPSGRWWQRRLGDEAFAYYEVQAGLARTQLETVVMPARADWAWTEAFGPLDLDAAVTHGADWNAAWRHAAGRLDAALPEHEVEARHGAFEAMLDRPPESVLCPGSGWGALAAREPGSDCLPPGTPFPESTLGPDQAPWMALLESGRLPAREPAERPVVPMVRPEWAPRLAALGARWDALLQLGILKFENGDAAGARAAWDASVALDPSAWALRNLAQLDLKAGRPGEAADRLARAWELAPEFVRPALARERLEALLAAERPAEALAFADALPEAIRDRDRIRLLTARAALGAGDPARAKALVDGLAATDLREGESAVEDLRAALAHEPARRVE